MNKYLGKHSVGYKNPASWLSEEDEDYSIRSYRRFQKKYHSDDYFQFLEAYYFRSMRNRAKRKLAYMRSMRYKWYRLLKAIFVGGNK